MSSSPDDLVALLKWQFSRVAYRAAEDGYEVNGVVLLSASEARLIIDGTASLEEVVASRNCQ